MHRFIARYCDLLNVVISCDGCERIAPWHRYRCLQCMDMDLCKTCFLSETPASNTSHDHENTACKVALTPTAHWCVWCANPSSVPSLSALSGPVRPSGTSRWSETRGP